jgi:hypothetical protein
MSAAESLTDYWEQMVTVALLGTDRCDPPPPPTGGLADLAADAPQAVPAQRLLQQVAACTVVRRSGLLPAAAVPLIAPPPPDPRPFTPPAATSTWRRVVDECALLEDEWLLAVIEGGRRLAPELVAPVLARHRTDAVRHTRALLAAGPLGEWLLQWMPRLACVAKRPAGVEQAVGRLPELPMVPALQSLLASEPAEIARALRAGFDEARFARADRAVLVNFVARVPSDALSSLHAALTRVVPTSPAAALAFALADLAALRHHMLTELES